MPVVAFIPIGCSQIHFTVHFLLLNTGIAACRICIMPLSCLRAKDPTLPPIIAIVPGGKHFRFGITTSHIDLKLHGQEMKRYHLGGKVRRQTIKPCRSGGKPGHHEAKLCCLGMKVPLLGRKLSFPLAFRTHRITTKNTNVIYLPYYVIDNPNINHFKTQTYA